MFILKKMKNIRLLFATIKEVCPFRIFFSFLTIIIERTNSILFSVLLIKYIVDNFDAGLKLDNIILIFIFCGVFQIITKLISTYYKDIYLPVSNIKIEKHVRNMIYDKARKIDLASYDTPEMYKKFTLAMSDSSPRIIELYQNMVTFVGTFYMVITIN